MVSNSKNQRVQIFCKEYNLDPLADGVVICHSEGYKRGIASNHGDVMHWFPKHGKNMNTFRADVKAQLALITESVTKPEAKPVINFFITFSSLIHLDYNYNYNYYCYFPFQFPPNNR